LWLAPVQVSVLTIAERHADFGRSVADRLIQEGIRADIDSDNEKIGKKIRTATLSKTPYMCIIGDKELERNAVTIRKRNGDNAGEKNFDELVDFLRDEISKRRQI
jgi:threonyl-tRNA synthetase